VLYVGDTSRLDHTNQVTTLTNYDVIDVNQVHRKSVFAYYKAFTVLRDFSIFAERKEGISVIHGPILRFFSKDLCVIFTAPLAAVRDINESDF